jgi:hypothetical protein
MRLSIYDQFIVGVVRPNAGWSKGRPVAYIEEDDKCVPLFDLLIPNDLDDEGIARFVSDRFCAFAQPGRRVELAVGAPSNALERRNGTVRRRGAARVSEFASVQR